MLFSHPCCLPFLQLYEGSLLHSSYQRHLSSSLHCYQQLSANLVTKFGQSVSSIEKLQGIYHHLACMLVCVLILIFLFTKN